MSHLMFAGTESGGPQLGEPVPREIGRHHPPLSVRDERMLGDELFLHLGHRGTIEFVEHRIRPEIEAEGPRVQSGAENDELPDTVGGTGREHLVEKQGAPDDRVVHRAPFATRLVVGRREFTQVPRVVDDRRSVQSQRERIDENRVGTP